MACRRPEPVPPSPPRPRSTCLVPCHAHYLRGWYGTCGWSSFRAQRPRWPERGREDERERREKQDTSETKGQAGREGSGSNLTAMAWPDAGHCPEGASWCSGLMFSSAGVRPVSTGSWDHSDSTSTQGPSSRRWQQTQPPGAPCSQVFPPRGCHALSALTFTKQAGSSARPGIEGTWVGRRLPHGKNSFCVFGGR